MSFCEIKDLSRERTNACVMGVIIAKGESKQVTSKYNGNEKSAMTFTVRDSKRHFINCNIWGTEQFVKAYEMAFRVGDVVVINHPKIVEKNTDMNRYSPQTTSPFQLTINEGHSYIYRESIANHPHLAALINESIKSTSLALHLADVCGDGNPQTETKLVDLVVAVRTVKSRSIRTKNGEKTIRTVLLLDASMESMKMTLWSRDDCERADKWIALKTILHLVDVQCTFSTYDRAMILQVAGATIITENPIQSSRVKALRDYIKTIPSDVQSKWSAQASADGAPIDLNTITDVMSVQKIKDQAKKSEREFTALLYGVITELDLDPTVNRRLVRRTCLHCNRYMSSSQEYCAEESCVQKSVPGKNYTEKFDIRLNVSDHTGTLSNCHMYDKYAIAFLNCDLNEYLRLPETAFEQINWLHMLERRAIKVLVKPKSDQTPFVNVLDIRDIDLARTAHHLKTY